MKAPRQSKSGPRARASENAAPDAAPVDAGAGADAAAVKAARAAFARDPDAYRAGLLALSDADYEAAYPMLHRIGVDAQTVDIARGIVFAAAANPAAAIAGPAVEFMAGLAKQDAGLYGGLRDALTFENVDVVNLDTAIAAYQGYDLAGGLDVPDGEDAGDGAGQGAAAKTKRRRRAKRGGQGAAARLLAFADECELYYDGAAGAAYASMNVEADDGKLHRENWPIDSPGFRAWLRGRFYAVHGGAASGEAMTSAVATYAARAQFESAPDLFDNGAARRAYMRTCEHNGALYIDLCDESWRAVKVTPAGWTIQDTPDVRFVRTPSMMPLPAPVPGGSIDDLRPLVNLDGDGFTLAVSWMLAAYRPRGPYPVLALAGEQGSAKSTTMRVIARLVDHSAAGLRNPPRDDQSVFVSARNSHVVAYDNLSTMPGWLSDCLCRLSTGAAFTARRLYTDAEETVIAAARPVLLNGIPDVVSRGDLADRAVFLVLAPIPDAERMDEAAFNTALDDAAPRIFGALLDKLAIGLRHWPNVRLNEAPRMADFAKWAVSCEGDTDGDESEFMAAYLANRAGARASVIETLPVAVAIQTLIGQSPDGWDGTPSALYERLCEIVGERAQRGRDWPTSAALMMRRIRPVQTALRAAGIDVLLARTATARAVSIMRAGPGPGRDDTPFDDPPARADAGAGAKTNGAANESTRASASASTNTNTNTNNGDAGGQSESTNNGHAVAGGAGGGEAHIEWHFHIAKALDPDERANWENFRDNLFADMRKRGHPDAKAASWKAMLAAFKAREDDAGPPRNFIH